MKKEIALQAVNDAYANLNVSEQGADNSGKWIKVYLETVDLPEGYSWCCAWLKYRYITAAKKLNEALSDEFLKLSGWCPDWQNYAQKHSVWITAGNAKSNPEIIKPGYAVFYYSDSKKRVYHTGIVVKVNNYGIVTIEANTSPGSNIEANGDGVYLKRRLWKNINNNSGFLKTY